MRRPAAFALALAAAACGGAKARPAAPIAPVPAPAPVKDTGLKDVTQVAAPDPWEGKADLIKPPAPAAPAAVTLPPVERFKLGNGLTVIAVARPELPVIGFDLAVRAGNLDEPRDKRILADFVADLLTKGTRTRKADQIANAIDFVGGHLAAAAGYENIDIACSVLARDAGVCESLLADVVMNPSFDKHEIELSRAKLLTGLARILDDPEALAGLHFSNAVFGEDHPRGWPTTARTIAAVKREDLVAFHKARFTPKNAVLAVAGDVDVKALRAELEKAFGKWKGGEVKAREITDPPMPAGVIIRLVDNPSLTQSTIVLGHAGITHTDPDFFAVKVMNDILGGGGFSSRLMKKVRAQGAKTYDVSSGFESFQTRGVFEVTTNTRTAETVTTLKMLLDELKKIHDGGVTAEELDHSKSNIAGSYALSFQTASDVATAVLSAELHGLDPKYTEEYPLRIGAVTREEVNAAAKRRIDPAHLAVVIVGNGDEVAAQLDKAGLKYERLAYTDPVSARDRQEQAKLLTAPLTPEEQKKGKEILDAAIAAKGGLDKLKGIKDVTMSGVAAIMGARVPNGKLAAKVERIMVAPDKLRIKLTLQNGKDAVDLLQVISGDNGLIRQGPKSAPMPPVMVQDLKQTLWRDQDMLLVHAQDKGVKARPLGQITDKGRVIDVVLLVAPDNVTTTTLFIDAKEHLLVRQAFKDSGGDNIEEYGDYREVSGVKVAFLIGERHAEETMILKFDKITMNSSPDAKLFDLK